MKLVNGMLVEDGVPMGKRIKLVGGNGQITVPPMDYRSDDDHIKLCHVLRECCSNAENYGATKAHAMMTWGFGHNWLNFMHDGEPFDNLIDDIIALGCRPFISKFEGKAFQGNGLAASSAGVSSSYPLLLIGSNTKKEGFKVGIGCPSETNEWWQFDATEVWEPELRRLLGNKLIDSHNVIYSFKFDLQETKARLWLNGKLFNTLAMQAPSILGDGETTPGKLQLYYTEKQIGYPYPTKKHAKTYSTYETARRLLKNSGATRRYTKSFQGLVARFVGKGAGGTMHDGHFEIPCKPFALEDKNRKETLEIQKATLHINFWPAVKNKDRGAHGRHFHEVLRDGSVDGDFKAGKQWEYGIQPYTKVFLVIPWLCDDYAEKDEDENKYKRFLDNSLGTYGRPRNIMDILNCAYNEKGDDASSGDAYVTIHVSIDEIGTVVRHGKRHRATAKAVFDIFGRRSDFTFSNNTLIHQTLKKAAESAEETEDLKRLRELCDQYFKVDQSDMVEIYENYGGRTKKNGNNVELSRKNNVILYDLEASKEAGEPVELEKELKPGSSIRVLAWHKVLGRFIKPDEVIPQDLTKGLTITHADDFGVEEAAEMIAQHNLVEDTLAIAAQLKRD